MEFMELLKIYGPAIGGGMIFIIMLARGDFVTKREYTNVQTEKTNAVTKAEALAKQIADNADADRAQMRASLEQASKDRERLLTTIEVLMEKTNANRGTS